MSEYSRAGRHRSATRFSAVAELSSIARTAGANGARVSAVLAASGGLVASFALPAQAALREGPSNASAAAPTTDLRAAAAAVAAPALTAPTAAAPVLGESVGVSGITAVKKPKPKPKPEPEPVVERSAPETASRSTPRPSVAQSASGVVNIARTLLGIPYLYGGTSPSTGFDCSGLTQYVFGKAGVSLPRTAAQQQAAATPVSDPQPGDLVFFGSPAWHVGIVTGDGMMIDSPKPGTETSERPIFDGVSGYGRF